MLDTVERQWHTASITNAVQGNQVEDWATVRQRFDDWLADEVQPQSKEDEMKHLLGLPTSR